MLVVCVLRAADCLLCDVSCLRLVVIDCLLIVVCLLFVVWLLLSLD